MQSPREVHPEVVYKILCYLKSTLGKGSFFKKNEELSLEAYTDVNWAGLVVDQHSTSGYCTFLGDNLVTWKNNKQYVVTRSSAKVEFRATTYRICELLWIKIVLDDLGIKWERIMKLNCDNKSTINIAHNPL